MISNLKNGETIIINMFGKEKRVTVYSSGDNQFDENGNYKEDDFDLNEEEINVLNWFIENIKIEDYKQSIIDYCNEMYQEYSDTKVEVTDIESEINITSIVINVTKNWKSNTGFIYPEISFVGNCKCDEENGICIGFRDKEFLGISSQDWTL